VTGEGSSAALSAPESVEAAEGYAAFHLEHRGIELIPDEDRTMRPWGLFWLWAGAVWNVEFFVYGALMIFFGLSFVQAVLAIVIGNLFYAFLGFASLWGPDAGTTAFMISRAPFGRNGNRLPSLFNWATQVGFEIEGIVLVVFIVGAMLDRQHGLGALSAAAKAVIIALAVAVQFVVPFLGHATIKSVLRYLSFVFIVLFAIMAALILPHVNLAKVQHGTSWWLWTTGLVLIVAVGGLGWTENAADYSRYLPRGTGRAKTFWAACLGPAIPSILLELLGAAAYSVSPNVTEAYGIPSAFAAWFFWPFMIVALLQLFSINSIDMYSSGVTLQAIGIPLQRWGCILIDTVVSGGITALVIFKGDFYTDLSGFLDYIVVWLGPWFGIVAVDYLLRRGEYHRPSLAARGGGIYWRYGGFNWRALLSLFVGMAAALMWIDAQFYFPAYNSPLSRLTGGGDLSWLVGLVVGAVLYWLLSIRSVAAETLPAVVAPEG
jgi:NCS1 family nucleobase:cation symporter-1